MGKTSCTAKNRYNNKAYDRITIVIPKGRKADVQAAAECAGESVNSYVIKAILARMGVSAWDKLDTKL